MKSLFTFLLVAMMFGLCNAQMDTMTHDGHERYYKLHIPPSYDGKATPLIIAMHGGVGSADNLEDQSQLNAPADKAGYIVVYPEGRKFTGIRTWNAGVCCGQAARRNVDDVGFISALIDTLRGRVNIDTSRIYATGMSNGGFMAYRLACELSDRIAAIAPVAASLTIEPCNPSRPVPVVHYHSKADASILHQGGIGSGLSKHYNPPLDSVIRAFGNHNKCVDSTVLYDKDKGLAYLALKSCSCEADVFYYLTDDGGHSWPGGKKTVIGDTVSTAISASEDMIDFFSKHSLHCEPIGVEHVDAEAIQVSPNPVTGSLTISQLNEALEEVKIYSLQGKLIQEYRLPEFNGNVFDISHLPNGVYTIRVNERYSKRIVVMNNL